MNNLLKVAQVYKYKKKQVIVNPRHLKKIHQIQWDQRYIPLVMFQICWKPRKNIHSMQVRVKKKSHKNSTISHTEVRAVKMYKWLSKYWIMLRFFRGTSARQTVVCIAKRIRVVHLVNINSWNNSAQWP